MKTTSTRNIRHRKASDANPAHARQQYRVGFLDPMQDGFADVRRACNAYLREKGIDQLPDFTFGNKAEDFRCAIKA